MNTSTTSNLEEFVENGFFTKLFPQELRSALFSHIDQYIREIGAPFIKAKNLDLFSLEYIVQTIPDEIWSKKMARAFRIFPKTLSHRIFQWANDSILKEFGKTRSAVNIVYLQEPELNPKLAENDLAIYWRCVRPGKPDAGRPHRDASFWELEFKEGYDPKIPFAFNYLKDCKKIWIPIKGCISTTTLQVIPSSHKIDIPTEVQQTDYGRRPGISSVWLKDNEQNFISPPSLSKGSCIVFDMNLVHRGPLHTNNELRISAELNFIFQ